MLFNSYVFMLAFLPLTLLGYFLLGRLPEKIQLNKVFLVLASFLFYGYNNPSYVPIIAGSILINYALSQLMLTQQKKALRLPLMLLGLFLNLGVLFYFKYHDFFFENLNGAFGLHLTLNHLALPLGISFFTFQQLSYVIDSYKRTVPRYNILDYSLFVTFFPQLIAGPIVLHSEIVPQFADVKNRHFNFDHFAPGLYAFARGLVKKVVIADTFAVAVEAGFADALTLNTAEAWFAVQEPQHPRILAAVACHALPLPDHLRLFPAWRQPEGSGAHLRQPDDRLSAQRPLAWRGLALPALGADARGGERALPHLPQAV